jgi:hypothetical protein
MMRREPKAERRMTGTYREMRRMRRGVGRASSRRLMGRLCCTTPDIASLPFMLHEF